MKKITIEFIRLGIITLCFIFIMALLFAYINQFESDAFQIIGELVTIPVMIITFVVPVWMVYDLIKKTVADKAIFNLTFFISIINVLLLAFAVIYLG